MKNGERVFYIVLIILQLAAVLYMSKVGKKQKVSQRPVKVSKENIRQTGVPRLFSFNIEAESQKDLIKFTGYSSSWYLIAVVSPNCNKCEPFLKRLNADIEDNQLKDYFRIIGISSDKIDKYKTFSNLKFYTVSSEDRFQFGEFVPKLYLVRGNGDILYSGSVFHEDYIGQIVGIHQKFTKKRSKKI